MSSRGSGAEYRYRSAWWLPGGHAQTIWGRVARGAPAIALRTQCFPAPDGDGIEVHELEAPADAPRVLLLHGLEGTLHSHYVAGLLERARERRWGALLMMHRGCGATPNLARRFYHSGETSDLALVFAECTARHLGVPWFLVGVSLGGNVMLKWLGELAEDARGRVAAAAAISVPFDLEAGARQIGRGFARIYDRRFLASLRRKAFAKLARYPDLFDAGRLAAARSVFEFDDAVTAPVHGFRDARDYYARSSSLGFLARIRVPTLLLSARNDPFLPASVLDRVGSVAASNSCIELEVTESGGHVGFVEGSVPWRPRYYAERRAFAFFDGVLNARLRGGYD